MGFKESYLSAVTAIEPITISAESKDAHLFKTLTSKWTFKALNSNSCLVQFDIAFEFNNPIYANLSSLFFDQLCTQMMHSFEKRAKFLYEKKL